MKFAVLTCVAGLLATSPLMAQEKKVPAALNFKVKDIKGKEVDLSQYQGKVVLIVNVASKCGYTKHYKGLQELHAKHAKDGLAILGFPSNDFGKQEPGTNEEVLEFCQKNYGVQFDMFSKIAVVGADQHPLYGFLTSKETNPRHAGKIQWNFEKFLIGRDGALIARFAPGVAPESEEVQKALKAALAK